MLSLGMKQLCRGRAGSGRGQGLGAEGARPQSSSRLDLNGWGCDGIGSHFDDFSA